MKAIVILAMSIVCVTSIMAMPTSQQLQQAQRVVDERTADVIADMKANKKTAKEAAAAHLALVEMAESEAAKYLLLQTAFRLSMRDADYDSAADIIGRMRNEISDFPPEAIVEICGKEMRGVSDSKAPRLSAIFRDARRIAKNRKLLPKLEREVRSKPSDSVPRRKLAECHACLGSWDKALPLFAKLEITAAKYELDPDSVLKFNAAKAADFWWDYTTDDPEPYRLHAAELYRGAIASNQVSGLRREMAVKRIAEMEKIPVPSAVGAAASSGPGGTQKAPSSATVKCHTIDLGNKVTIEFVECPPATFVMGFEKSEKSLLCERTVTITRPFWFAKTLLTLEQYKTWDSKFTPKEDAVLGGDKSPVCGAVGCGIGKVEEFLRYLTHKFKDKIPKGYVFRLPTSAEWEYAYTAGETDVDMFYGYVGDALKHFDKEEVDKYVLTADMVNEEYKRQKGKDGKWKWNTKPGLQVAKFLPNRWGIYDMAGPQQAMLGVYRELEDSDTDPVNFPGFHKDRWGQRPYVMVRNGKWNASTTCAYLWPSHSYCFRVVVGPDIVAEKIAAQKAAAEKK